MSGTPTTTLTDWPTTPGVTFAIDDPAGALGFYFDAISLDSWYPTETLRADFLGDAWSTSDTSDKKRTYHDDTDTLSNFTLKLSATSTDTTSGESSSLSFKGFNDAGHLQETLVASGNWSDKSVTLKSGDSSSQSGKSSFKFVDNKDTKDKADDIIATDNINYKYTDSNSSTAAGDTSKSDYQFFDKFTLADGTGNTSAHTISKHENTSTAADGSYTEKWKVDESDNQSHKDGNGGAGVTSSDKWSTKDNWTDNYASSSDTDPVSGTSNGSYSEIKTYKTDNSHGLINGAYTESGRYKGQYDENGSSYSDNSSLSISYKDAAKNSAALKLTDAYTDSNHIDSGSGMTTGTGTDVVKISKLTYSDTELNSFKLVADGTIHYVWDDTNQVFTEDSSTFLIKSASFGTADISIAANAFTVLNVLPGLVSDFRDAIDPADIKSLFAHVAPVFKDAILMGANTIGILSDGGVDINGGADNDSITGAAGADTINGGTGNDVLTGGAGNDIFVFNEALSATNVDTINDFVSGQDKLQLNGSVIFANQVFGSAATLVADTSHANVFYETSTGKLYYDEDGVGLGTGDPTLFAILTTKPMLSASDFTFDALSADDQVLVGTIDDDTLDGGLGNDSITGAEGNDSLLGGSGNDVLAGESGNDTLNGGTGADHFEFALIGGSDDDVIEDFTSGADVIDIGTEITGATYAAGVVITVADFVAWDSVVDGTAVDNVAVDATDHFLYDTSSGELYYDEDGNGAASAALIATLQGAPTLLAGDLHII
jgi:Ca2+-binding RTX toxin-like protein